MKALLLILLAVFALFVAYHLVTFAMAAVYIIFRVALVLAVAALIFGYVYFRFIARA